MRALPEAYAALVQGVPRGVVIDPFALRCSLILCMPVRPLHSSDAELGCAQTEKQKMLRVILALAIVSLGNAISVQRYATQVRTHTLCHPPARLSAVH